MDQSMKEKKGTKLISPEFSRIPISNCLNLYSGSSTNIQRLLDSTAENSGLNSTLGESPSFSENRLKYKEGAFLQQYFDKDKLDRMVNFKRLQRAPQKHYDIYKLDSQPLCSLIEEDKSFLEPHISFYQIFHRDKRMINKIKLIEWAREYPMSIQQERTFRTLIDNLNSDQYWAIIGASYFPIEQLKNSWRSFADTVINPLKRNGFCNGIQICPQEKKYVKIEESEEMINGDNNQLDFIIQELENEHKEISKSLESMILNISTQFKKLHSNLPFRLDDSSRLENEYLELIEKRKARLFAASKFSRHNLKSSDKILRFSSEKDPLSLRHQLPKELEICPERYVCQVCDEGCFDENNLILFCARCSITVHQNCYGLTQIPKNEWICSLCLKLGEHGKLNSCMLCTRRGGAMIETNMRRDDVFLKKNNPAYFKGDFGEESIIPKRKRSLLKTKDVTALKHENSQRAQTANSKKLCDDSNWEDSLLYNFYKEGEFFTPEELKNEPITMYSWVHLSCLYWIPETTLNYENMKRFMNKEIETRKRPNIEALDKIEEHRFQRFCFICKKIGCGAVVQCADPKCRSTFHPECARRTSLRLCSFKQGAPSFKLYCHQHYSSNTRRMIAMNRKRLFGNLRKTGARAVNFYSGLKDKIKSTSSSLLIRKQNDSSYFIFREKSQEAFEHDSTENVYFIDRPSSPTVVSISSSASDYSPDLGKREIPNWRHKCIYYPRKLLSSRSNGAGS